MYSPMRVFTVSQIASYLRELLETNIALGDVWISGEVSGPRTQPSGHSYFTLKDEGAQLRSVLFRNAQVRQRQMLEYLVQGAQVIAHGRLTFYEARGDLQLVVDFLQPEGVGLGHARYERLRLQLEEEGLFDQARKRPLPPFPRRIGVVTSPAGAVFHDICNIIRRRWPLTEVVLAPTSVQGPEAAPGIVAALADLNRRADTDVIIVARGGGSVEELWAFNEEEVARAVFGSLIPVVSAVGHETDFTICDYVADIRAPTPSAAAELVTPDGLKVRADVQALALAALAIVRARLNQERSEIRALAARTDRAAADLGRIRQRLDDLERRAVAAIDAVERDRRQHLRRCQAQLEALNPQATLDRGYAVVHRDGRVVSSVSQVGRDDPLVIKVSDGGFPARVEAPGSRRRRRRPAAAASDGDKSPEQGVQKALFM